MGYDCAFSLRGSGARVFVFEYVDMGYDCAALCGSGARVSVCGYADMGKECAFVFLGLVLEFTAVLSRFIPLVVQRPIPMVQAVSADHGDFSVAVH